LGSNLLVSSYLILSAVKKIAYDFANGEEKESTAWLAWG
jgi:hypothetical protein